MPEEVQGIQWDEEPTTSPEPTGIQWDEEPVPVGDAIEKERNIAVSYYKGLWNAMWYQSRQAGLMTGAAAQETVAERAEMSGSLDWAGQIGGSSVGAPVRMAFNRPAEEGQVEKFTEYQREVVKTELFQMAMRLQEQGAEYTKDLVNSLDKAEDWIDYINWASHAMGQAMGQIPAAMATSGGSALILETGEIYQAGVEKIAEEKGITVEEVLAQGLDDPAVAIAFGTAAAALETVGAGKVITAAGKNMAKTSLRRRLLAILGSGQTEAATEGAQSIIEQVGANISADGSILDIDWNEVKESAAQGLVGGGGLTLQGQTLQTAHRAVKGKDAKEKLADELTKTTGEKHVVTEDERIFNKTAGKEVQTLDDIRRKENEGDAEIDAATSTGDPTRDATIEEFDSKPNYVYKGDEIDKNKTLELIAKGDVAYLSSVNDADTQRLIDLAKESKKVAKAEKQAKKVEKPTPEVTVTKEEEVKPEVKPEVKVKFPTEEKVVEETDTEGFLDRAVRGVKKENVDITSTISVGEETHSFKIDSQEDGTQKYSKAITREDGTTEEVVYSDLGKLRNALYASRKQVKEIEKATKPKKERVTITKNVSLSPKRKNPK
jgi:hypothetical protein